MSILRRIDITRAGAIDGWMLESELEWLAEQAQRRMRIVEIGCYKGRSTRALAEHTGGIVFAVDDWRLCDYEDFQRNVLAETRNVSALRMLSHLAARLDLRPDMVFIDGDHDYEAVKQDILTWHPLVRNGLLCGHDYGVHAGVTRAVDEIFSPVRIAPQTTIWFVQ